MLPSAPAWRWQDLSSQAAAAKRRGTEKF